MKTYLAGRPAYHGCPSEHLPLRPTVVRPVGTNWIVGQTATILGLDRTGKHRSGQEDDQSTPPYLRLNTSTKMGTQQRLNSQVKYILL